MTKFTILVFGLVAVSLVMTTASLVAAAPMPQDSGSDEPPASETPTAEPPAAETPAAESPAAETPTTATETPTQTTETTTPTPTTQISTTDSGSDSAAAAASVRVADSPPEPAQINFAGAVKPSHSAVLVSFALLVLSSKYLFQ